MVWDPHYVEEIQLLWPGTAIPSPATVSHDVSQIYQVGSKHVKEYFLPKHKKAIKVSKRAKQSRNLPQSVPEPEIEEIVVELGCGNDDLTPLEQEMLNEVHPLESGEDGDGTKIDDAKEAHDREVVTSVHAQAIEAMRSLGITVTPDNEKTAFGLFPKACGHVSGLACHLHDSPSLQAEFEWIMNSLRPGGTNKTHLDHHVPTHWNSDFACLMAHFHFKDAIQILTQKEDLALEAYALTWSQWRLAEHLIPLLELFDDLTLRFSQAEVPMIYEVIPMLKWLEHSMTCARDAAQEPSIIRIAAEAALLMIGKYYVLTDDNEVYQIAIVMCPEKKIEWFDQNPDWHLEDRIEAHWVVQTHWDESYSGISQSTVVTTRHDKDGQPKVKITVSVCIRS
ncbi:hypothetical protein EDC04DRAFT_2915048 [Pisolithus marmoratus]|nr:hypothetical protein EDC04DRAFT_2915048 [Pisolithus marmoratus]